MNEAERTAMAGRAYDLACRYEREFHGCAQCTIAGMHDALGVQDNAVYQAASGLAAGGGECTTGNCGGFTGASMVLASFFGRSRADESTPAGRAARRESSRMTREVHDRFMEKYGSVLCHGVQRSVFHGRSFDLRDERQKQEFHEAGAHADGDKCCMAVGDGAKWGVEILLRELESRGLSLNDFRDDNGRQVRPRRTVGLSDPAETP